MNNSKERERETLTVKRNGNNIKWAVEDLLDTLPEKITDRLSKSQSGKL